MFLSFMNYFAIQCFPDTYNLVREGPNITPHVTDLMVRAKKILGHEGRCEKQWDRGPIKCTLCQAAAKMYFLPRVYSPVRPTL